MKILAIIPARGGSKGIPKKNISLIGGKPLISWTIEEALKCNYISNIVLSSDDSEIIDVGNKYDQLLIHQRPAELATDEAKTIDVILNIIDSFEAKNIFYDYCLLLQPTSPLRTVDDINSSIKLLLENKYPAVVSVCEAEHHPLWSNTLPEDLSLSNFIRPEIKNLNRQQLPKFYRLSGAIFIATIDYLRSNKSFIGNNSFAYVMPLKRSIDVDTVIDLKLAEILLENSH